jgi:hypothetical protein
MALANVALTDTLDTWRIRTNQIIINLDQIEKTNVRFISNTSTIWGTGNIRLGEILYLSSNALPNTGGTITGSLNVNQTLTVTGNINLL